MREIELHSWRPAEVPPREADWLFIVPIYGFKDVRRGEGNEGVLGAGLNQGAGFNRDEGGDKPGQTIRGRFNSRKSKTLFSVRMEMIHFHAHLQKSMFSKQTLASCSPVANTTTNTLLLLLLSRLSWLHTQQGGIRPR